MLVVELVICSSDVAVLLGQSLVNCSLLLKVLEVWVDEGEGVVLVQEVVLLNALLSLVQCILKFFFLNQEVRMLMLEEWSEFGIVHLLVVESSTIELEPVLFNHLDLIVAIIGNKLGVFVLN